MFDVLIRLDSSKTLLDKRMGPRWDRVGDVGKRYEYVEYSLGNRNVIHGGTGNFL